MNTDNVYRSLSPGDVIEKDGIRYAVVEFILHLDLILVYARRLEDNTFHWVKPNGMMKVIN